MRLPLKGCAIFALKHMSTPCFLANFAAHQRHTRTAQTSERFRPSLGEHPSMKHALNRLAGLMYWDLMEHDLGGQVTSGRGRPAFPLGLVAGLCTCSTLTMRVTRWWSTPGWRPVLAVFHRRDLLAKRTAH